MLLSGIEQPDSEIGVYAGDADCYEIFAEFFDPLLAEFHQLSGQPAHFIRRKTIPVSGWNVSGNEILSTRIRAARNVAGYPFTAQISLEDRVKLETVVVSALQHLPQPWSGQYYGYATMTSGKRAELLKRNQLFDSCDRFQVAAGMARDWPAGRGVFVSDDHKFSVWVNEEDHLRIISTQPAGDLGAVYNHMNSALEYIGRELEFECSERIGYLTSCPSNVGTGMRASFHLQVPHLEQMPQQLKDIVTDHGLALRGTSGEHSNVIGSVFDVSFRRRLGVSEDQCLRRLLEGTTLLLQVERSLAD